MRALGPRTNIGAMLPIPSALRSREAVRVVLDALRRPAGPLYDAREPPGVGGDDRACMAVEIEHFIAALNRDLIGADDFRWSL